MTAQELLSVDNYKGCRYLLRHMLLHDKQSFNDLSKGLLRIELLDDEAKVVGLVIYFKIKVSKTDTLKDKEESVTIGIPRDIFEFMIAHIRSQRRKEIIAKLL